MWRSFLPSERLRRCHRRSVSLPSKLAPSTGRSGRLRLRGALAKSVIVIVMPLILSCAVMPRMDNGARLIEHPQFPAAAKAAPELTIEFLNTIAELEAYIEKGD